jgi:hypothetical protein
MSKNLPFDPTFANGPTHVEDAYARELLEDTLNKLSKVYPIAKDIKLHEDYDFPGLGLLPTYMVIVYHPELIKQVAQDDLHMMLDQVITRIVETKIADQEIPPAASNTYH